MRIPRWAASLGGAEREEAVRDEPEAHTIDIARRSESELERPEQGDYVDLGGCPASSETAWRTGRRR